MSKLDEVVSDANTLADRMDVAIRFSTSEENGTIVVQVADRETGEIIRQIPPESFADRLRNLSSLTGLLTEPRVG